MSTNNVNVEIERPKERGGGGARREERGDTGEIGHTTLTISRLTDSYL
jgi:hypothetical protein